MWVVLCETTGAKTTPGALINDEVFTIVHWRIVPAVEVVYVEYLRVVMALVSEFQIPFNTTLYAVCSEQLVPWKAETPFKKARASHIIKYEAVVSSCGKMHLKVYRSVQTTDLESQQTCS